jgi:hypothetical protein
MLGSMVGRLETIHTLSGVELWMYELENVWVIWNVGIWEVEKPSSENEENVGW